ncbi:2371_t:CDS:2, partial [Entrophospora sp. SA101]
LDNKSTQVDMMLELCNYGVEIISVEVGNTEELNIDDMKVCRDHTALKIELKDMLDNFRDKLYFVKEDYTEIFMIGIQVSGIEHGTIGLYTHFRIIMVQGSISFLKWLL